MSAPHGQPGVAIETSALRAFGAQADGHLRLGFERSRHAMLLADDRRRWVTGNAAACSLLGIEQAELPWSTMDASTSPAGREHLDENWGAFLAEGAAEGWYDLVGADRSVVRVEFSAIANVVPARHLSVFIPLDVDPKLQLEVGGEVGLSWAAVVARGAESVVLTVREREVMTLLAAGGQTGDIARQLFVSPETVKTHVRNAMAKLDARTRAHAVAISLVSGRIDWSLDV